jgi:hypothetical protein
VRLCYCWQKEQLERLNFCQVSTAKPCVNPWIFTFSKPAFALRWLSHTLIIMTRNADAYEVAAPWRLTARSVKPRSIASSRRSQSQCRVRDRTVYNAQTYFPENHNQEPRFQHR